MHNDSLAHHILVINKHAVNGLKIYSNLKSISILIKMNFKIRE